MQTATAAPAKASMIRVDAEFIASLDALAAELNARPGAVGTVTRSDVVRAILARRLRDRKPGDLP